MARSSNRSTEKKKKNFSDFLMNMKDIPFVRNTGGAMCSPCQAMCFASRCWIAIYKPLQLAECPDEIILFGSSGFLKNCFPNSIA